MIGLEIAFQWVAALEPLQIDNGVIVEQTTEWGEELADVVLGEGVSESVGKGQQAASGMDKADGRGENGRIDSRGHSGSLIRANQEFTGMIRVR